MVNGIVEFSEGEIKMGHAAYNRASRVISARIDAELSAKRQAPCAPRCLCGASRVGNWTTGVHHGAHRCARVVTLLSRS
jgi:hypothetical protein